MIRRTIAARPAGRWCAAWKRSYQRTHELPFRSFESKMDEQIKDAIGIIVNYIEDIGETDAYEDLLAGLEGLETSAPYITTRCSTRIGRAESMQFNPQGGGRCQAFYVSEPLASRIFAPPFEKFMTFEDLDHGKRTSQAAITGD